MNYTFVPMPNSSDSSMHAYFSLIDFSLSAPLFKYNCVTAICI